MKILCVMHQTCKAKHPTHFSALLPLSLVKSADYSVLKNNTIQQWVNLYTKYAIQSHKHILYYTTCPINTCPLYISNDNTKYQTG